MLCLWFDWIFIRKFLGKVEVWFGFYLVIVVDLFVLKFRKFWRKLSNIKKYVLEKVEKSK